MSAYEVLRRDFPDVSATDLAQLAMVAQWLSRENGVTDLKKITRCVRVLFQPPVSQSERAATSEILRNVFKISSVEELRRKANDASRNWRVEWNPSLVREYGISPTN